MQNSSNVATSFVASVNCCILVLSCVHTATSHVCDCECHNCRVHDRCTSVCSPEQMTAECWHWYPRWNRLASSTSCFSSSACLQSSSSVLCKTAYGLESPQDRLGGTHAEGAGHSDKLTVHGWHWCRRNTLLMVLEALGVSCHCRQKCDIRAISAE